MASTDETSASNILKQPSQDSYAHENDTEGIFIHHAEAVSEQRDAYGPAGLRGITVNPYVALCAGLAAMGGLLFGYDQGVVSVVLTEDQFLSRFPRVNGGAGGFWKGFLTAMIELGALLGALNQGWIADKISRKYSITVAVCIFTVGSVLQTAAVDYAMLIVGRFIGGIGIGMLSMVAPLYISEISPPEIRGALLVLEELSIVSGIVVSFWITYGTRYISTEWAWRLPFLLQIIPGLFLGVCINFLPFSPRWLVSKGRNDKALSALARLRTLPATDSRVMHEWYDIRSELIMSGVLNITQLVGVTSSLWTMDRFGRRPLLLWGSFFMAVSHLIIAVLVALLLFYMLSFGASWGPVPWAMPAEIFPSSLRAKGVALSTCSNWLNNFIIGLITPPLVQNTGYGAFTFFAVFCLLSLVWTFLFVPETSGRSLEAMDHVFKDINSEEEETRRKMIERNLIGSIREANDSGSKSP
ncbi:uncharacterized protein KY384_002684 [Bacidia gigantensis]|uniref:uncharacterized protein n=1 Tax=Bacidia gigantensis TaxID=2732470 RepID=UPI001D056531|nr:uncharacterized protein KY384_002684 [Bacidia gigantensis]KAG8532806.1 hypothetical protein KY384_002684 [Bacidia gigantensis]